MKSWDLKVCDLLPARHNNITNMVYYFIKRLLTVIFESSKVYNIILRMATKIITNRSVTSFTFQNKNEPIKTSL